MLGCKLQSNFIKVNFGVLKVVAIKKQCCCVRYVGSVVFVLPQPAFPPPFAPSTLPSALPFPPLCPSRCAVCVCALCRACMCVVRVVCVVFVSVFGPSSLSPPWNVLTATVASCVGRSPMMRDARDGIHVYQSTSWIGSRTTSTYRGQGQCECTGGIVTW